MLKPLRYFLLMFPTLIIFWKRKNIFTSLVKSCYLIVICNYKTTNSKSVNKKNMQHSEHLLVSSKLKAFSPKQRYARVKRPLGLFATSQMIDQTERKRLEMSAILLAAIYKCVLCKTWHCASILFASFSCSKLLHKLWVKFE